MAENNSNHNDSEEKREKKTSDKLKQFKLNRAKKTSDRLKQINKPKKAIDSAKSESRTGLSECPECGHEVSKSAFSCPNCGHFLFLKQFYPTLILVGIALFIYFGEVKSKCLMCSQNPLDCSNHRIIIIGAVLCFWSGVLGLINYGWRKGRSKTNKK